MRKGVKAVLGEVLEEEMSEGLLFVAPVASLLGGETRAGDRVTGFLLICPNSSPNARAARQNDKGAGSKAARLHTPSLAANPWC